ncbi:glycosyltransferase family 4 protein [Autumnicola musiva]|uniref:Glycosyltransferase family 4 protein n=1 Tax=Autumnicola musiva TaxID=3075589 RepID=A0ABU3D835_9FLAO|nr:glycosyltransferase family 4 protein [Zunongwangia sp. F117]MDT0677692.1 glycosyltransferase family 4 protein [Zunongwangia sp. F117]
MTSKKINVVYLTQVPGPYRERMHEILANEASIFYSVIYCAKLEPNRDWELTYGDYNKYFLAGKSKTFRHNNPSVWKLMNKLKPDALIISAFKPTMLYAIIWCLLNGGKIIVYNDGTLESERNFSKIQKFIRKIVFKKAHAFVAPGKGSMDLYRSYEVPEQKMFRSCLCIDNSKFINTDLDQREYHIMFAGQIVQRKMPLFFVEVAKQIKRLIPELKILIVGDGDQREEMLSELIKNKLDYTFAGFVDQDVLPSLYSKAKLFLFPTLNDPWGVVANEACASGTAVIISPVAGAANDLIVHGENGYVLSTDPKLWAEHIVNLLKDEELLSTFSKNALKIVQKFNHHQSANGIMESIEYALPQLALKRS